MPPRSMVEYDHNHKLTILRNYLHRDNPSRELTIYCGTFKDEVIQKLDSNFQM